MTLPLLLEEHEVVVVVYVSLNVVVVGYPLPEPVTDAG
jgi:hypothetical protein